VSPAAVGAELKGSRGKAYVVISVACAAVTGTIIGFGIYATNGSDDWTPLFKAMGAFCVEFIVFVLILVAILRGLTREARSGSTPDVAIGGPTRAQGVADSQLARGGDPWPYPARRTPRMQRRLRASVAYAAYTMAVVIAAGLGSVAGAITETLIGRNDLPATGVALVAFAAALVPLLRIARLVARGLTPDKA
jgi:hypothetical protein